MAPSDAHESAGISRRDAIVRALTAAGAGYVVPMILGSATPALAQVSGGSICVSCGELPPFSVCAPGCSCYGRADAPFGQACVEDNPIDDLCSGTATTCDTADQCGPGELCIVACGTGTLAGKCHTCCAISAPG